MFEFNPELIEGDDEEADDAMVYEREDDEVHLRLTISNLYLIMAVEFMQ